MTGITPEIDDQASFATLSDYRQLDKYGTSLTKPVWRRHARTIIAGTCRYGDRLPKAKLIDTMADYVPIKDFSATPILPTHVVDEYKP